MREMWFLSKEPAIWDRVLDPYTVRQVSGSSLLAMPVVSDRERSRTRLRKPVGSEAVVSWRGEKREVKPGALRGNVDGVSLSGGRLVVHGWAIDTGNHKAADWILVFSKGQLLAAEIPTEERPDVADDYGDFATLSGYRVNVSLPRGKRADLSHLRVIALADDRASELTFSEPAKEATAR